jgi:hypothetical protein
MSRREMAAATNARKQCQPQEADQWRIWWLTLFTRICCCRHGADIVYVPLLLPPSLLDIICMCLLLPPSRHVVGFQIQ